MQPKWLIAQLEEFSFQSYSQSALSDTIRKELLVVESIGVEHSARLDNDVVHLYNVFKKLQNEQQKRIDLFNRQAQQTERVYDDRLAELASAEAALQETIQEQRFWQKQRTKADNWLTASTSRLNVADRTLASAQNETARASTAYNAAVSDYNYARSQQNRVYTGTDSKGNSTYRWEQNPATAERHLMNSAESGLTRAKREEGYAVSEVKAARIEKAKAHRQVQGACAAVDDTFHAQKSASSLLLSAQDAQSHIKDAQHSLQKNGLILEIINENLQALESCIERQNACRYQLKQYNGDIINILNNNEQIREELSYEIYKVRQVLDDKVKLLSVFDRPIFMG